MILKIVMIFFASFGIAFITSAILSSFGFPQIPSIIITFLVVRLTLGMLMSKDEVEND